MCVVLNISRSGFYKWLNEKLKETSHQKRRRALLLRITSIFTDSYRRYGSPKITKILRKEGWTISERLVGQIMGEHGLRSCVSRKFRVNTTDSNHDLAIAPNVLNQQFKATSPDEVWMADITYIPCREGRLYLASIMACTPAAS